MKLAFQIAPWAALLIIGIFWCPLHALMPCGNGLVNSPTAPVSVVQVIKVDSANKQLPQVQTASSSTSEYIAAFEKIDSNNDKIKDGVSRLIARNARLEKRHRSDSLSFALISIQKQNTATQNRLLREFVDGLTTKDEEALVARAIFEKKQETRKFRKEGVAEVTVNTTMYQNGIEAQTASIKDLSPSVTNNITSHYKERFQVYGGGAISTLTNKDFNSAEPFGGPAIDMKFSTGTNLGFIAQVNPKLDVMLTLKVTQMLQFPRVRAWIEKRKIKKSVKNQSPNQ
jgi:hypothetical protein